ncbi:tripartite tricarboxylate transporter TctB family protein [Lentibacillus jeotgali]|uniref:tripartite tricarboxylate transporter TctB family protein n=1 Tax=Lentibacillus jeotgali TaxID=558169 RepID=UPI0002627897|nr:tripartite tricarboxylate transporter TctB family protein [Lentibacillus jeotgali]
MSKEVKSILFTFFLFIIFCYMGWEANSFSDKAKFFPFFVAIGAAVLSFVSLVLQSIDLFLRKQKNEHTEDIGEIKRVLQYVLWVVGYIALIYVVGLILATILFLLVFLLVESKFRFVTTVFSTVLVIGGLFLISNILNLYWPSGLLGITIF